MQLSRFSSYRMGICSSQWQCSSSLWQCFYIHQYMYREDQWFQCPRSVSASSVAFVATRAKVRCWVAYGSSKALLPGIHFGQPVLFFFAERCHFCAVFNRLWTQRGSNCPNHRFRSDRWRRGRLDWSWWTEPFHQQTTECNHQTPTSTQSYWEWDERGKDKGERLTSKLGVVLHDEFGRRMRVWTFSC